LSFNHTDARGIKRLQRLGKVKAEMPSADAVARIGAGPASIRRREAEQLPRLGHCSPIR